MPLLLEKTLDAVSDSNCLWQLEPVARGTEKRIDNSDGIKNYKNFEVVLKGVISVYSLINGLESRGGFTCFYV